MTSLFYGFVNRAGVPADEKNVRNTATPVLIDKPAAMMEDQPVQQELETDPDPTLGLSPRQLASKWHEGHTGSPGWIDIAKGQEGSFERINQQVATSGTAAAREQSGVVNPNLSYAVGIEPVGDLSGAGHFGEMYFKTHDRDIQETTVAQMTTPPGYGQSNAAMAATGKDNARDASSSGALYNSFWNGGK